MDTIVNAKFCVIGTGNKMAPIPIKCNPHIPRPIANDAKSSQIRLLIKLFSFIRALQQSAVNDPRIPINKDNATIDIEYV